MSGSSLWLGGQACDLRFSITSYCCRTLRIESMDQSQWIASLTQGFSDVLIYKYRVSIRIGNHKAGRTR